MNPYARSRASIWLLSIALTIAGCNRQRHECRSLIFSINDRGSKLAETCRVTSNVDAKPGQVAAALRPFSLAARATGENLASGVLTFAPTPEKMDSLATISAWETKFSARAQERARVAISDSTLMAQVTNFEKGFKAWISAATTLVGLLENAEHYDELTKAFNAQIDVANKTIDEVNLLCRG